jgi:multidrug efflux system membrane fusion protein
VKLGPTEGENVQVDEVKPGELVVTDGADRLREGMTVQLAGEDPAPGAGGAGKGGGRGEGRKGFKKGTG